MGWFNKKKTDSAAKSNKVTKSALERAEERGIETQRKLLANIGKGEMRPRPMYRACIEEMRKKECMGEFTDDRDGQIYRTVKIGNQVWMAEDLKFDARARGSKLSLLCANLPPGRQESWPDPHCYDWMTASFACPTGWHVPTLEEWNVLFKYVGGRDVAGKKLKATIGWYDEEGTDDYGFSALPNTFVSYNVAYVIRNSSVQYSDNPIEDALIRRYRSGGGNDKEPHSRLSFIGGGGGWWTATDHEYNEAYYIGIQSGESKFTVFASTSEQVIGYHVRCVHD